jgi:hypothetical protein
MWFVLGAGAIIFAALNVVWSFRNKESKWFRFVSLALTALTICAFYSDGAVRVVHEDWGGLMDIMPTMSKALWVCVMASIIINSVSLFRNKS